MGAGPKECGEELKQVFIVRRWLCTRAKARVFQALNAALKGRSSTGSDYSKFKLPNKHSRSKN